MAYETFYLRFEGCSHTTRIPLQHNSGDHDRCFLCHPELREVPATGNARLASARRNARAEAQADSCGKKPPFTFSQRLHRW